MDNNIYINNNMENYSLLSDKAILRHYNSGEIIIEPFNIKNLAPNSYDVSIGEWFYREQPKKENDSDVYNIYSESDVKRVWGEPQQAKTYEYYNKNEGLVLENIYPDDKIIFIGPGETMLGHTVEFIGGVKNVTSMMKARSSVGRNFIKTCACSGLSEPSYFNRWTMEITNTSTNYTIPLVVGRRIAQIVFFSIEEPNKLYCTNGKYQTESDLPTLMKNWKPSAMLPKMYNDFEVTNRQTDQ
jgi:deoxycytidine triphosphate deaminase